MGTKRVKLNYQKDLNPSQKLTLELLYYNNFSIVELASILGMRKDNFKSRVLSGIRKYVRIDKKGFVTPRKDIDKVLEKNFDNERLEDVQNDIKKERDNYKIKMLFEPLRRLLEEADEKKLYSSIKTTS